MGFTSAFEKSVKDFKNNFKSLFLGVLLFIAIPTLIVSLINILFVGSPIYDVSEQQDFSLTHIFLLVIFVIISGILFLIFNSGVIKASLKKNKFSLKDITYFGKKSWLKFLGGIIVFFLFITGLFFLLIIPAIIFFVYWIFYQYVLFDEEKGILYSLKRSRSLVKGKWWSVLGYILFACVFAVILQIILYLPFQDSFSTSGLILKSPLITLIHGIVSSILVSLAYYGFLSLFYKNLYLELKNKPKKK